MMPAPVKASANGDDGGPDVIVDGPDVVVVVDGAVVVVDGAVVVVDGAVVVVVVGWSAVTSTLTATSSPMVTSQVSGVGFESHPVQPVTLDPAAGVAVSVIVVPGKNAAAHVPGQSIGPGVDVTVPVPEPLNVTVSSKPASQVDVLQCANRKSPVVET